MLVYGIIPLCMSKKRDLKLNTAVMLVVLVMANITRGPKPENINKSEDLDRKIKLSKQDRTEALEDFFEEADSPLKDHAETFVEVADKYGLDYKLLPAISCIESSCGKKLIEGSYNPFGWGIYGENAVYFESWDDAIETVGKGIRENYVEKGYTTPEKIAPVYTPPNSIKWLYAVKSFMYKIENCRGLPLDLTGVALEA